MINVKDIPSDAIFAKIICSIQMLSACNYDCLNYNTQKRYVQIQPSPKQPISSFYTKKTLFLTNIDNSNSSLAYCNASYYDGCPIVLVKCTFIF